LLQEFDLEIKDKKGCENNVGDHLSRLENDEVTTLEPEVLTEFPYENLLVIKERPWFVNMANLKAIGAIHENLDSHQRRFFFKMPIIMFGMTLICLKLVQIIC